jgi:solute carrier family 25 (mitochondrial carrier protein), member 16
MALPADFWYRSFKELSKAVNSYIPTLSLPLPDDLIQVIQAYLDKHYLIEESDSQRLHDELLNIYERDVKNNPNRYSTFIAILRLLRPALTGSARVMQWWETVMLPMLDHLAEEKGLVFEYRGILLDILIYDTDGEKKSYDANASALLSEKLLELWLKKASMIYSEAGPEVQYLEEQVKQVLIEFGKKRPKVLITHGPEELR